MTAQERMLDIVRRSLERGHSVEIDGLGRFRRGADGAYRFDAQVQPQVFVAYVEEDLAQARRLCLGLAQAGMRPWLDKDKLLPGQNWPRSIERAISNSDAFVACFSPRSIAKRGQFQSELRFALDCARRLPLGTTFLVPVRFEECLVPRRISDQVQYVDLHPDWDAGLRRVVGSVRRAARRGRPPAGRLRLDPGF